MAYLHGFESIVVPALDGSSRIAATDVAFIVGLSPEGTKKQQLVLSVNQADDAQFGPATPANDIATSLAIMRATAASTQNPGGSFPVIVVNVFDATKHTADLSQTATVTGGKLALKKHLYGAIVCKEGSTTITTDKYTLDAWGNFKDITTGGTLEGKSLTFTGKYVIPAQAADIVGTVDVNNVRTGMKLHSLCYNTFGYTPKKILTPKYSTLSAVFAEGRAIADANRGEWLHDCDTGDTVNEVIAARASGTIGWNTSHERTTLLYPWLKTFNTFENADIVWPYSAFYCGASIKKSAEVGWWQSSSNTEMNGVTGAETVISCSWNDSNAECQRLNGAGITTYINGFGIGFRTFGNRNASFPTINTGAYSFIKVKRVDDILAESIELSRIPFLDRDITQSLIDMLVQGANMGIISILVQRGALLPGSQVKFVPGDNPTAELASGTISIRRSWMTGVPAEKIRDYSVMDINLLRFKNNA